MTPGSIVFIEPNWFWMLPFFYFVAILWRQFSGSGKHIDLSFSITQHQRFFHPLLHLMPRASERGKRFSFSNLLFWLLIMCFIIALSQPVRIGQQLPDPPRKQDIVFIVDTSLSMVLRDYTFNNQRIERINLLKSLLGQFVEKLQGERISIIVFGETADTLVPLTPDQDLLTAMISRISAGMVGRYNAIGDAIALAVREAGQQQDRQQVLLLFTDAGQYTGNIDPHAAAQLSAERGLPLYTVAIGAATSVAEEKNQRTGLLYQTVDMEFLNTLAQIAGAKSYQAADSKALQQTITDITLHEKNIALQNPLQQHYYKQKPLYIYPLFLGLLLLTLFQSFISIGKYRELSSDD